MVGGREHTPNHENNRSMMIVRFFSAKNLRFLRAIRCEHMQFMEEVDLCSSPCCLWVLNSERIMYYGLDGSSELICNLAEHKTGLMDPAFWILMSGDARAAACYIKHTLMLNVNQHNLYSHDNLLFSALKMSSHNPLALLDLLDEGLDVNSRDEEHRTPLMIACAFLFVESIGILLRAGADPCAVCGRGQTAAFYVGRGRVESVADACPVLHMLYAAGTPMHQPDYHGSIPLFQKTLLMNVGCVALLASLPGFDVHVIDPKNGYTALHYLMQYSGRSPSVHIEHIMSLLVNSCGLDANIRSKSGQTPLMIASDAPNPTNVHLLLSCFKSEPLHGCAKKRQLVVRLSLCLFLWLFLTALHPAGTC